MKLSDSEPVDYLLANMESSSQNQHQSNKNTGTNSCLAVSACVCAAFGGLLFGYDTGIISGALLQLRDDFSMSCLVQEIVVSGLLFGAVCSSLIGGVLVDKVGRKMAMMMNCLLFICGAIVLATATSVPVLVFGRFLVGGTVGLSVVAECTYISEVSPAEHRGKLVSCNEVAICLGFLLAFLTNYLCIDITGGWRIMFGLAGIPAALQLIGLYFVPKSPRFLLINGSKNEAYKVLVRLRGDDRIATSELSSIESSINFEKSISWSDIFSLRNSMLYRMALGVGLVLFQQFSGQPTMLYYAPILLKQVGYESNQLATLAAISIGVTKVIGVVLSLILVDRVGRRKLLIFGISIMIVGLFTLAAVNKYASDTFVSRAGCQIEEGSFVLNTTLTYNMEQADTLVTEQYKKWLSLIVVLFVMGAYTIGFGPVTWLVLSEIFPTSVKGRAVAFAGSLNWLANILISFTFLDYMDFVGLVWTFVTYGISCVLAFLFVLILIPETKGQSLEAVNDFINRLVPYEELSPNELTLQTYHEGQQQDRPTLDTGISSVSYTS